MKEIRKQSTDTDHKKSRVPAAVVWFLVLLFAILYYGSLIGSVSFLLRDAQAVKLYNTQIHVVRFDDCFSDESIIEEEFPSLGTVESCRWDSGVTRKETYLDSFFNIGPTEYWVNGYAVISEEDIDRLMHAYAWKGVHTSADEHFKAILDQMSIGNDAMWLVSDDLVYEFGGYYGEFYINRANHIVIFDLEKG